MDCPHCFRRFELPLSAAPKQVFCPSCGKALDRNYVLTASRPTYKYNSIVVAKWIFPAAAAVAALALGLALLIPAQRGKRNAPPLYEIVQVKRGFRVLTVDVVVGAEAGQNQVALYNQALLGKYKRDGARLADLRLKYHSGEHKLDDSLLVAMYDRSKFIWYGPPK